MPSASLFGRLIIGAGALAMMFAATAGLTGQAQARAGRDRLTALQRQRPADTSGRHLTALRPSAHNDGSLGTAVAPRVSSVVPAEGAFGWRVNLYGGGFRHVTSVKFGGVGAAFKVLSAGRITATVPGGAKTGRITVTARGGKGRSATFTVTPEQTLKPGETLPSTDWLMSKDGHFTLVMQAGGNLVYYVTGTKHMLWSSATAKHPGAYLTMLSNGNLVIYAASGAKTLWSSGTSGAGPARLVARTNGNLVVYAGSRAAWGAGSHDNMLEPGESLQPGWFLSSGTGYQLTMRSTGNLAERGPDGTSWSTRTWGHPGATVTMRTTGNLAVHDGSTLWASKTTAHPGARLIDRRNGVLAVRFRGRTLWTSKKTTVAPLTSIVMSEMNDDSDNGFWMHAVTKAAGDWPTAFIHVAHR